MSSKTQTRTFLVALIVVALAACAGAKTDRQIATERMETYLKQNPDTKPEFAAAMRRFRLAEGMTQAQVRAAWGNPVSREPSLRGQSEGWVFGCDFPHTCRERATTKSRRALSRVTFTNGLVSSWRM